MRVRPPLSCGLFAMSRLAYLVLAIVLAALPQSVSAQRGERWVASWVASPHGPYPVGNPSAQPDQSFAFPVPAAGATRPDLPAHRAAGHLGPAGAAAPDQRVRHASRSPSTASSSACKWAAPGLVKGTNRPVTFGGKDSITVAPGASVWSDAVQLTFVRDPAAAELAGRKLAVSFHVAGESGPMTWHAKALQTSYVSRAGQPGRRASPRTRRRFPTAPHRGSSWTRSR